MTVCRTLLWLLSKHQGNHKPKELQTKAQTHLSLNCPSSSETSPQAFAPGEAQISRKCWRECWKKRTAGRRARRPLSWPKQRLGVAPSSPPSSSQHNWGDRGCLSAPGGGRDCKLGGSKLLCVPDRYWSFLRVWQRSEDNTQICKVTSREYVELRSK